LRDPRAEQHARTAFEALIAARRRISSGRSSSTRGSAPVTSGRSATAKSSRRR
jgi:hypothetical protein